MNPIAICVKESGKIVGYACGQCHLMSPLVSDANVDRSLQMATDCCAPKVCEKHGVQKNGYDCRQCSADRHAAIDQAAYNKATKVKLADYDGEYLYLDGHGRDGYFSVGDLDEEEDSEGDPLEWAWGCFSVTVTKDDCDLSQHVSECILQEHHEDAGEEVDQAKVREAEKLLFEACKGVSSYQQDTSVVVLLRDEAAE